MKISLAPFRVGSVNSLNTVPLTWELEDQVVLTTPAQLAARLQRNELDAALVSVTEVLFHDRYEVVDGVAIASRGEVKSVFLAHRVPLADLEVCWCDPASLTSVNLLRVLLAERGIKPRLEPLADYAAAPRAEAVLLIGDRALDFARQQTGHRIWDLGLAWRELTALPFVYAVWAMRRGLPQPGLEKLLRAAKTHGLNSLEDIIRQRTDYEPAFRRVYFAENIRYDLGPEEKQGMKRFIELLRRHGNAPVFEPRLI